MLVNLAARGDMLDEALDLKLRKELMEELAVAEVHGVSALAKITFTSVRS